MSERRLRADFEQAPIGLVDLDLHGLLLHANRRFCALLSMSGDDVQGRPLSCCLHPDDRAAFAAQFARLRETGEPAVGGQVRLLRDQAAPIWTQITLSLIHGPEDQEPWVMGVVEDISVRKASEDRLRLFEAAVVHAHDAVLITEVDAEGSLDSPVVYVNDAFTHMSGYAGEDIVGRGVDVLNGPDTDLSALDGTYQGLLEGRPGRAQLLTYRKDGSTYWSDYIVVPVPDRTGRVTHWISIERDVTLQRRTEEALRESERRLRTVVGSAPVILWATDRAGAITLLEGRALAGLGISAGTWVGSPAWAVRPALPITEDDLRRAMRGELVATVRTVQDLSFEVRYTQLYESGEVCGVIGVATDITERLRAEEALRHLAMHDSLTGLPNRRMFQDSLSRALAMADAWTSLAVFLIDLNHFKEVNDTLGHPAGDLLLWEVGQRLQRALRGSDLIARLGGDEFGILLVDLDDRGVAQVARKILRALADPLTLEGQEIEVSASIGIAQHPQHGTDAATLLKHADVAMYTAKRNGGGYRHYHEEQPEAPVAWLSPAAAPRGAIT